MKKTFLEHLEELRERIKICFFAWIIFTLILLPFSPTLINELIKFFLPPNWKLIISSPLEILIAELIICCVLSLALTFPLIIYHFSKFLYPGLKKKEKCIFKKILSVSIFLTIFGILFALFIFLPLTFRVLALLVYPVEVEPLITLTSFLNFILTSTFFISLFFNLPIFLLFLQKLGMVDLHILEKNRKYILLAIFIIICIITPDPTPLTSLLLFIPVWILYEFSIWLMKNL